MIRQVVIPLKLKQFHYISVGKTSNRLSNVFNQILFSDLLRSLQRHKHELLFLTIQTNTILTQDNHFCFSKIKINLRSTTSILGFFYNEREKVERNSSSGSVQQHTCL